MRSHDHRVDKPEYCPQINVLLHSHARGAIRRSRRSRPVQLEELERRRLLAYTVNSTGIAEIDDNLDPSMGPAETHLGTITLRSAIEQVNIDGGGEIDFASSVPVIVPIGLLPAITAPVLINGGPNKTIISGASSQLKLTGDHITIENIIQRHLPLGYGIGLLGNYDALVNCYIGVEPSGTSTNSVNGGVYITGSHNTVTGCLISGNLVGGVYLYGSSATGNLVTNNLIGTDVTGTKALGNAYSGVIIANGASNNTIGGPTTADANVISGNGSTTTPDHAAVAISGTGTTGNVVKGNLIGTDISGTKALGNAYEGVSIFNGATNNTISGNLISGNGISADASNGFGLAIQGTGTSANVVTGNFIGTDVAGTKALGNAGSGVSLFDGATDNTIGGVTAASANLISGNSGNGVDVMGQGTSSNSVQGNKIGTDVTGAKALGNGGPGLEIDGPATGNTIGGMISFAAEHHLRQRWRRHRT